MRSVNHLRFALALSGLASVAQPAVAQDVGVPACDKVLKTYETCVIPKAGAAEGQMKAAFSQMRTNWLAVAATADGKKNLEPVCTETTAKLKAQLTGLNCDW